MSAKQILLSEPAETLLKDFFELNPPTVLDPGHITSSASADQKIQFVLSINFEVTLASCGLFADLLALRGLGALSLPGGPRRSPCPSAVGSLLGDSVALRSRYSLPNVTGMTVTSGSDVVVDRRRSSVDVPSSCHEHAIADAVVFEDVPLAMIADQERVRRVIGKKKVAELHKMSREGRPSLFSKGSIDEGV